MDVEYPAASSKPHKPIMYGGGGVGSEGPSDSHVNNNTTTRNKNKKRCCCCRCRRKTCIWVSLLVVVLSIVLVVVLVTVVFKAKNPETTINNVSLEDLDMSLDILNMQVKLNVSLHVSASIENPNKVGFKFTNTSVVVNYKGQPVGDVPVPASKISAGGTLPLNLTLTLMAERLISHSQIYRDVLAGSVPLSTFTKVSGKVSILGFINVHVDSSSSCDFTVFISNRTVGDQHCNYHTKF